MATKKIALVTGANKGLGFEIARQLGHHGITVLLAARDDAKAGKAAEKLKSEGLDVQPIKLDVTNPTDISNAADLIREKFGRLDILINNAGVLVAKADLAIDDFRSTFETNVFAPFVLTKALLPLLIESPAGRIVNQSSILGSITTIGGGQIPADFMNPAYTSSKAALNMLTVVTAQNLKGTKVKVNAVHPGWVKTDMGGDQAPLDVTEGAKTAVDLALVPDDGPTGGFVHLGNTLPW
jgi:NAD(P)-dependent dehydrogenase (short-subunit alcohol dehydrogenase family)